jgi:hypothetical protein
MTLAEAEQIFAYWAEHPPTHLMVQAIARIFGWKPVEIGAPSLDEIVATVPPGLSVTEGGGIGMPAPVLDIEALRARNRARLAERRRSL